MKPCEISTLIYAHTVAPPTNSKSSENRYGDTIGNAIKSNLRAVWEYAYIAGVLMSIYFVLQPFEVPHCMLLLFLLLVQYYWHSTIIQYYIPPIVSSKSTISLLWLGVYYKHCCIHGIIVQSTCTIALLWFVRIVHSGRHSLPHGFNVHLSHTIQSRL